ncbi:MAG: OmpW/AlkL family protein [Novosphingobium sp.]|jgi:outer membrane protein|uniref:OmpW/AlkL family protein n=1 Tax=Novosphingobium sp. TaxID=1874826 RepID=UPI00391CA020|nr:outer membrane beta-barrel protein [Novosphingobium sp.]
MKKLTVSALLGACAILAAAPAHAGSTDGKIQIKVLATGVLPDGKITKVLVDPGLPARTDTKANDNWVPTLAIEYFVSPQVSIETICCLTQHDVDASAPAALAGGELVADAKILPATVTLKYHFTESGVRPYIGVGPTWFIFIDEKPGAAARTLLAATSQKLDNRVGAVVQAGIDIPINDQGFGISFDAKRYFLSTTAHWYNAAGTQVLSTRHKLDPWVVSGGVSYRF